MVFIHGGGYSSGSGSMPGLQTVVLHGQVILATLNYRLGPLGFLSTEDQWCPGNFGLWDQLQALRWLKDNAVLFGGDPDRILVFGEATGGACVTQLMASPHSEGLFQRVIAQSGSAYNPWALGKLALQKATYLSDYLSCPPTPTSELVACLKRANATDLVTAPRMQEYHPAYFGPVIDWDFFTSYPDVSFQRPALRKIQYMGGAIITEGYQSATNPNIDLSDRVSYFDYIKQYLGNLYLNVEAAFAAVMLQYFSDVTSQASLLEAGVMFFHDGSFAAGAEKIAQIHAR